MEFLVEWRNDSTSRQEQERRTGESRTQEGYQAGQQGTNVTSFLLFVFRKNYSGPIEEIHGWAEKLVDFKTREREENRRKRKTLLHWLTVRYEFLSKSSLRFCYFFSQKFVECRANLILLLLRKNCTGIIDGIHGSVEKLVDFKMREWKETRRKKNPLHCHVQR